MKNNKSYIIHIGINKTGSSAIQENLFYNRYRIQECDYVYPQTGIMNEGHHFIAQAIKGAKPGDIGLIDNWFDVLMRECDGFKNIILSSELFHTIEDPSKLKEYFPVGQTKIVLYIRAYAPYLTSFYQQSICFRNITSNFEEFICLNHVNPCFYELIDKWKKVYGVKNVEVRLYDRELLIDNDIVKDFLSLFPKISDIPKIKKQSQSNPSISGNLLFLKKILNSFIQESTSYSLASEMTILSSLDKSFLGKIHVPEHLVKKIQFEYRYDRNMIHKKFGILLPSIEEEIKGSFFPNMETFDLHMQLITRAASKNEMKLFEFIKLLKSATTPKSLLERLWM